MRWIRTLFVFVIFVGVVDSCLKQPEYSVIPYISSPTVTFKHEFPTATDSLIVTLKFTDGDGDLGLDPDETAIYTSATDSIDINSPFYYVYDTTQSSIWYYTHDPNSALPKGISYVNYASYRKIHSFPFDTLPSLTCKKWEYEQRTPADTLFKEDNLYNYNIYVYLYTKNSDGTYTYFDPTNPVNFPFSDQCLTNPFNGRFPILSTDLGKKSPLDGTITYRITSVAFYITFHGQTAKLKMFIFDRALHKSNVIETEDFIFN